MTPMPLCWKLRRSFKINAHPVLAQMLHPDVRDDLLPSECATASSRRPKQSHCNDESHTASNAISINAHICTAVNVGLLRLMVQHPPKPILHVPSCIVQLTNMGYLWLVCTLLANTTSSASKGGRTWEEG